MRKLILKIEDLSVETFNTRPQVPARGTVVGADQSLYSAIGTCPRTCLNTCWCDTSHAECLQTYENTGICC